MASLNMGRSYPYTETEIDQKIEDNRIGNYALGYLRDNGIFVVRYVGRSDSNLRERIKHGLNEYANNPNLRYERFKFSYAKNIQEAYQKECHHYHDFGENILLINNIHPARPENTNDRCPICDN